MPAHDVTFSEMVACIDREARLREKIYPRWIRDHKLLSETADLERRRLAAIRARLIWSQGVMVMAGQGKLWGVDQSPIVRQAVEFVERELPPVPEWLA